MSLKTKLQVGMSRNDRMLALANGNVSLESFQLEFAEDKPSQIFWRALHDGAFDVAEMSVATHAILTARGESPFIGIPVFTSRMFRHNSIFIRNGSGITTPQDLIGRRIGVPEYQMTAAVWMRGTLYDHYGVSARDIFWFTGGVNTPGRIERLELRVPDDYKIAPIGPDRTLNAMIMNGEIDAIMSPEIPASFHQEHSSVRRLFDDCRSEETAYFRRTGIFPMMHLLVVRRQTAKRFPKALPELFRGFSAAKQQAFDKLYDSDALRVMLPWLIDEIEKTQRLMGPDYWPYGFEANRVALRAFVRHLFEQGMIDHAIEPEALFALEMVST